MKGVFLLLLIVVSGVSVSAQRDYRHHDRDERYHYKYERNKDVRKGRNGEIRRREFQRQVALINTEFDERSRSIRKNPFMSRNQKNRKLRELETHRRMALNECRDRFIGGRGKDYARERKYNNRRW